MTDSASNRRDFLTGQVVRAAVERAGSRLADELSEPGVPSRGPTLMLQTTAMACDFDVMLNPDDRHQVDAASLALNRVHELEQQLSVYRADSELSELNRQAYRSPVEVESRLFELLLRGKWLSESTEGAFDPAAGALIHLWRRCRQEFRIPSQDEVDAALAKCGVSRVQFDSASRTVVTVRDGVELIWGHWKGDIAVDRAGEVLLIAVLELAGAWRSKQCAGPWTTPPGRLADRDPEPGIAPTALCDISAADAAWRQAELRCSGFVTSESGTGIFWIRGPVGQLTHFCRSALLHRIRRWPMRLDRFRAGSRKESDLL